MKIKGMPVKFGSLFCGFIKKQDVDSFVNYALIFVLAIIVLFPLLRVGITTYDDAIVSINYGSGLDLWEMSQVVAKEQGRIGFLWGYPALRLPYLLDSWPYYLVVKYGSFLILLSALCFCVGKIFKSTWVNFAIIFFFLSFVQNGWGHNALTSYPFAFNLYAALFLASLGVFSVAIEKNRWVLAILSALLYFFALGIELFVLYFPFYVAILLSGRLAGESLVDRLKSKRRELLSVAIGLMVYLALYIVWRKIYPSNYDGTNLNGLNLLVAIKVIGVYSLSAFPFNSGQFIVSPEARAFLTDAIDLRQVVSDLNPVHFIKSLVAGLLFYRLMATKQLMAPTMRTIKVGAALSFVGIFIPNFLLGFVTKHQEWVGTGSNSYLYTYYSFISAVVFASLVLSCANFKSRFWHPGLRWLLVWTGVVVVMAISFAVEMRNQYVGFDQKLSNRKWQLMNSVVTSPAFMGIPDGSIVLAPTLSANYRGLAVVLADYWSKYTKYKTGKSIQFVDDKCSVGVPCYTLVFHQEKYSDNQFIVLGKMDEPELQTSSNLTIFSMPKRTNSVIVGTFETNDDVFPELAINGVSVGNVGNGVFSADSPLVEGGSAVQTTDITGNVGVFSDQITLSH